MRSSRPPAAAAWLLSRFAATPTDDSLAGDLMEEYARGRSRAWYWRQVLFAIAIGFWAEVATHKLFALRALFTGWMVFYWSVRLLNPMIFWLSWRFRHGSNLLFSFALLADMLLSTPASAAAGWIVGRLHRPYHASMALLFALSLEVFYCQQLPWTYHLLLNSLGDSRYRPYLATTLVGFVVRPLSVLAGGLWSAPEVTDTVAHRRQTT